MLIVKTHGKVLCYIASQANIYHIFGTHRYSCSCVQNKKKKSNLMHSDSKQQILTTVFRRCHAVWLQHSE